MQHMKDLTLAALFLAASLQYTVPKTHKSARQPFPKAGFWVIESKPDDQVTTVKYYANSNHLLAETVEPSRLDISKLSVRKYLNNRFKVELEKDTTLKTATKLYEIN